VNVAMSSLIIMEGRVIVEKDVAAECWVDEIYVTSNGLVLENLALWPRA
jgi:hypothetical protein